MLTAALNPKAKNYRLTQKTWTRHSSLDLELLDKA